MKRFLLLALGIVLGASVAFGQAGCIMLFSDYSHRSCELSITYEGTRRVYVYQYAAAGVTASRFAIRTFGFTGDPETDCELVEIKNQFTGTVGNPFFEPPYDDDAAGVQIEYGACNTSLEIYILRIQLYCYEGEDPPPACIGMEAVPDPAASTGTIEVMGCDGQRLVGCGTKLYVNPDQTCECMYSWPHAVEESTWGKVKALYN